MDDELRILHEAMVMKERLRVLAELQASYLDELTSRGVDSSTAEQLLLDWSRSAFSMTFRAVPEPSLDQDLMRILGDMPSPGRGAVPPPPEPVRSADDPSRVPPGEPWLQLVRDVEDEAENGLDDLAA